MTDHALPAGKMNEARQAAHADEARLFERLAALGIAHETVRHRAVFTVDEGRDLKAGLPGGHTKNLFLKDKKGRLALITAHEATEIALNHLHKPLEFGRFSFGKPGLLKTVLGVAPGSVTPLALLNAPAGALTFFIDAALLDFAKIWVHPLANTASTGLAPQDLVRFAEAAGHPARLLDFTELATKL